MQGGTHVAMPIKDLRAMPDDRLIAQHDEWFGGMTETSTTMRTELARRDQERQTNVMLRMTKWIAAMTVRMTVATIVNVVLFALS